MNELDTLNTGGDYDLYESAPLQVKAPAIPNTIKASLESITDRTTCIDCID